MKQKQRLICIARELTVQGIALESARGKLRRLVEAGVPYTAEEMSCAAEEYQCLQERWFALEKEYLSLRDKMEETVK